MRKFLLLFGMTGAMSMTIPDAFAQRCDYGWMHGPGMMGGWWWPIMMAVFWAAVIMAIFLLVRWLLTSSTGGTHPRQESALEILKKRYARGEIDKQEFEEKKKDLGQDRVGLS